MSGTRVVLRTVGAVVLVLLAVALALLAADVLAWRGQTERADLAIARYSQRPTSASQIRGCRSHSRGTCSTPVTTSNSSVPCGEFSDSVSQVGRNTASIRRRSTSRRLELEFDDIATRPGPAEVRSRARQLHAILLFQQLILRRLGSASTALDRTITELRSAVRIDPSNVEAQYDLESLLIIYKPIATEIAGELAYRRTSRGNIGGAGGSPGNTGETGGY